MSIQPYPRRSVLLPDSSSDYPAKRCSEKSALELPCKLRFVAVAHVRLLGLAAIFMLSMTSTALAKNAPAKQTIYADGEPVKQARVSLYDCKTGSLYKGPLSTANDGSVVFPDVEDGVYCERTDISAGYASKEVRIDTTIQNQRVDLTEIVPPLSLTDRTIPFAFCVFTVLLVIYPIGRYLAKPWAFRRDTLIGQLSGESMELYYKQFRSGELIPNVSASIYPPANKPVGDQALKPADYESAFAINFNKRYGRRYYIAPVIGLAALTAICAWWGCMNLWLWISGLRSIESMFGLTASAIAGAFVWIISDELDRLRRRDFTSTDVYYYIFRILIAVPFAWALTRLEITLQLGIPIAFLLGAFPTTTLFTAARRIANSQLKLGDDPASGNLELEKLQTVGKGSAERFKDEGISTISQLAYADPVDLTIRTNFDFNYVSDCISQALLWIYFGDQLQNLSIYSLRGSFEAWSLMEKLKGDDPDNAKQTLIDVAAALAANKVTISTQTLQVTLHQAAYDPYTKFLADIWK
jgi:hypothetical protein